MSILLVMGTRSIQNEAEIWRQRALAAERRVFEADQGPGRLDSELGELNGRLETLEDKSRRDEQRIAGLEVDLAKARKTSRNSSKPASSDIVKPASTAPITASGKRPRGGQAGHANHVRENFPLEQIDRVGEHSLERCPCCGERVGEGKGVLIKLADSLRLEP